MNKPIQEILIGQVKDPKIQEQWARQYKTAEAIIHRYQDGLDTVLLADEVGMGKTYVAMAVIAEHIFQTAENDRKVLLVVPPNNILARKWEQDLRSFNEHYVLDVAAGRSAESRGKSLRHLSIETYWDLIQNLHDFKNQDPTITKSMVECIAFIVHAWRRSRLKKGSKFPASMEVSEYSPEYLEFCSVFSKRAFFEYLDHRFAMHQSMIESLLRKLKNGDEAASVLKTLFRDFARNQDSYEANVFIMGMAALRKKRVDRSESQLFNTYITSFCLKSKHADTRRRVIEKLGDTPLLIPRIAYERWEGYCEWVKDLGNIDLWGLAADVRATLDEMSHEIDIEGTLDQGGNLIALYKKIQDKVIARKLAAAGIGLSVVDEVHNWKNGGNGAEDYRTRFAPWINRKLILSATPFQIEEDELKKVFAFASGAASGRAMDIVNGILGESGPARTCLDACAGFRKAWEALAAKDLEDLQQSLAGIVELNTDTLGQLIEQSDLSDALEAFLKEAMRYHTAIKGLQTELRKIILRHTKDRKKRHFHSGHEFTTRGRPDYRKIRQALYETPGYGNPENALINFLAMRVDQLIRRDDRMDGKKPKAHLMGGITSSNQAFQESNQQLLKDNASLSPYTRRQLEFFQSALAEHTHPKVSATAERALENYRRGNKTLIFCERLATLKELEETLDTGLKEIVFTSLSQDEAKAVRKVWLAQHLAIEIFWHASYLQTLDTVSAGPIRRHLEAAWPNVVLRVQDRIQALRFTPNERQRDKLLDLGMAEALVRRSDTPDSLPKALVNMVKVFAMEGEDAEDALRQYLRLKKDKESSEIDDTGEEVQDALSEMGTSPFDKLSRENLWFVAKDAPQFHRQIWTLLESETAVLDQNRGEGSLGVFARLLLDLPQGLRKVLVRTDLVPRFHRELAAGEYGAVAKALTQHAVALVQDDFSDPHSPWDRTHAFLRCLNESEGSINRKVRRSSKRQGLWKGVFLGEESIVNHIKGGVSPEKRINLCAAFNSPLAPDILICTSIGSEGIDLHRYCADVIHHDLPWNPAKLEQRTGRVDRVGSRVELHGDLETLRLNIGIPFLAHNYEKFQYELLLSRAQKFEILLGKPEFPVDVDNEDAVDEEGEVTGIKESEEAAGMEGMQDCLHLPDELVAFLRMDLSVA